VLFVPFLQLQIFSHEKESVHLVKVILFIIIEAEHTYRQMW